MRPSSLVPLPVAFLVLAACNEAPSAPQIALNPGQATTTQDLEVVFLSLATDGNKDEVTHRFTWFQDGTVRSDLTTDTVPASETTKGETWKVVVIANDGELDGPGAEAEAVIVNTPPVASVSLTADPATDADLVAEVTSTDDDADTVTYTYAWTRDGQSVTRTDATIPASETAHGETWTVTVTPNDGEEDGEAVTASVTVANTAPAVERVELAPSPAYEDSVLTATAFGVDDLDDDAVTLTYTWFVNDTEVQSGEDDTLTGALFSKHDLVRVEVTPTDGFVDGATVASDDLLVENTVPAGTSVSVVSSSADEMAYEASALTCTPTGWTDADGDAESWTYTWQVDGATTSTAASIDGSLFSKGSVVACVATPTDGEASGAPLTSSAVRVGNTAPVLAGASLSTTAPTETDVVSATLGAATDDDGDTITYAYAWNVDGVLASTSATLSPSRFSKGNRITLTVTPYDGTDLGAPVTTSEAIAANTAPTVSSVSLTPASVYTNSTITANAVSSDLDGDTVSLSYDWTVNGVPVGASGSTLDGSVYFDKNDTVSVSVTPNDGERDGTALASSSVTVRNTLPTAPGVSIDPADPDVGDTLICDVTSPSTDADGDPLTYTYAWTENGTAFTSAGTTYATGDTVAGTWVGDSDTFVCSVTASDGTGTSGAGTDTVTAGGPCSSVRFDGVNDYADVANPAGLATSSVSVSAWWRPRGASQGALWSKKSIMDGGFDMYAVYLSTTLYQARAQTRACSGCSDSVDFAQLRNAWSIPVATWHHIVQTYDAASGAHRLYLDGTLVETSTVGSGLYYVGSSNPMVLGATVYTRGYESFMNGDLDDVLVYNRALTATEVSGLAAETLEPSSGLLAAWRFDEGSGTSSADESGNGHTATLSGATFVAECR